MVTPFIDATRAAQSESAAVSDHCAGARSPVTVPPLRRRLLPVAGRPYRLWCRQAKARGEPGPCSLPSIPTATSEAAVRPSTSPSCCRLSAGRRGRNRNTGACADLCRRLAAPEPSRRRSAGTSSTGQLVPCPNLNRGNSAVHSILGDTQAQARRHLPKRIKARLTALQQTLGLFHGSNC
jgi:hypothetical protein